MEIETFFIEGPLLIKPTLFTDDRGCFLESFSKERYENLLGVSFVQDNLSRSKKTINFIFHRVLRTVLLP